MSILTIQSLAVSYGSTQALRGVSLEVSPGEIVCVLGPNGAGKSTLMNTISGLVRHDRGDIVFDGSRINDLAAVRRARIGIVQCPEGRRLFETLTVGENLRLGASRRARTSRDFAADLGWLSEIFPILRQRWGQQAGTLSGGEQQMVALARSLMAQPRVLLLDEPTLGLAPRLSREVLSALPIVARDGVAIFVVEQNARAVLKVADRGYLLGAGSITLEGSPDILGAYLEKNHGFLGLMASADHEHGTPL